MDGMFWEVTLAPSESDSQKFLSRMGKKVLVVWKKVQALLFKVLVI